MRRKCFSLSHPYQVFRLLHQVVGSAFLQRERASATTIYTETKPSSCATSASGLEQHASYTWIVLTRNEITSEGASSLVLETGRDPRVLSVPPYALGFAGSSYVFQLSADVDGITNTVNVTGEIHPVLMCYSHYTS